MTARLSMRGLQKHFGATIALRDVSFEIKPGEVHALIGENGAGKSTVMKILSGATRADAGKILLEGQTFLPLNPLHARRAGIAMIYQELTLAPDLSVEENIVLGQEPARFGWISAVERRALAHEALRQLNHQNIPLTSQVRSLPIAEQQIVEIARSLITQPKLLIMDEPTSSLTRTDIENLFAVIARLKERGVSIIYISHFLEECRRVADRYTVLRDGRDVATGLMSDVSIEELIRSMVGREIEEIYPREDHLIGAPAFELQGIAGKTKPGAVTLNLRRGEILGIAGLVGAGRTETLRVCFGLDRLRCGRILVWERESTRRTPAARWKEGVGLLSENRKEEGLMLARTIADNVTLTSYRRLARGGFLNLRKQKEATLKRMQRLGVQASDPAQPVVTLSGGNQQKVALARLLQHEAEILLLDEPTKGIDVGSKAAIYRLMGELAAQGCAVIFVSSYLPELVGVCDTIAVMCRGMLSDVRPVADWTEHSIMMTAIGEAAPGKS